MGKLPGVNRLYAPASVLLFTLILSCSPLLCSASPPVLKDINPEGSSDPHGFTKAGEFTYFTAFHSETDRELWRNNGSADQTALALVLDIKQGPDSSDPDQLTELNRVLYFTADDGVHGLELWRTDGERTEMVKDIYPGETGSSIGVIGRDLTPMTTFMGKLYLLAMDPIYGKQIWTSDGTNEGTEVLDFLGLGPHNLDIMNFHEFQGELYFVRSKENLYKTDGAAAGTVRVGFIDFDRLDALTSIGDAFYAVLRSDLNQSVLGTLVDGKLAVLKVMPATGFQQTFIRDMTEFQGELFFRVDYHYRGGAFLDSEFWKSDSTTDGTVKEESTDEIYGVHNGELYFTTNSTLAKYQSNGQNIRIGPVAPYELVGVDGRLFVAGFGSENPTRDGLELWISNGTFEGTDLLKDIWPGRKGSFPQNLTAFGGRAYFTADDRQNGREMW